MHGWYFQMIFNILRHHQIIISWLFMMRLHRIIPFTSIIPAPIGSLVPPWVMVMKAVAVHNYMMMMMMIKILCIPSGTICAGDDDAYPVAPNHVRLAEWRRIRSITVRWWYLLFRMKFNWSLMEIMMRRPPPRRCELSRDAHPQHCKPDGGHNILGLSISKKKQKHCQKERRHDYFVKKNKI